MERNHELVVSLHSVFKLLKIRLVENNQSFASQRITIYWPIGQTMETETE